MKNVTGIYTEKQPEIAESTLCALSIVVNKRIRSAGQDCLLQTGFFLPKFQILQRYFNDSTAFTPSPSAYSKVTSSLIS